MEKPKLKTEVEPSIGTTTEIDLKTTLEFLKQEDRRLREALEQKYPDDKAYNELRNLIVQYSEQATDTKLEGFERARKEGAIANLQKKLEQTNRFQLSQEFNQVSLKREKAESEVARLVKLRRDK